MEQLGLNTPGARSRLHGGEGMMNFPLGQHDYQRDALTWQWYRETHFPLRLHFEGQLSSFRSKGANHLPRELFLPLAYNKGIFMPKVLNNNSPNCLAQLFISHQSHYTNSRNNLYVPRPRLDLFKTSISFVGASLWNSLPHNIKSCISLPCFKCNLHKYMSENNLSLNLDRFVWITRLHKNLSVVYMYVHERNLILMFPHVCRNSETALINCLIMLIIIICLWYCCVYLCL